MKVTTKVIGTKVGGVADLRMNMGATGAEAALKTPNQSDFTLIGRKEINKLQGDFVVHQLNLDDGWHDQCLAINAPILDAGTGAKAIRVLAATTKKEAHWCSKCDANLIAAVKRDTGANIAVLPSSHKDTKASVKARLAHARSTPQATSGLGVTIGLHAGTKHFKETWDHLVGQGEAFIAVNIPGYKSAVPDLQTVANTVASLPEPPFALAYNATRWPLQDPNRGAGALIVRAMGFQTISYRVYRPFEPNDEGKGPCWYNPVTGGYSRTPPAVLAGPSGIAGTPGTAAGAQQLTDQLNLRRYDETWNYTAETPKVRKAVQTGTMPTYRSHHAQMDGSMQHLGI